MICLRQYLARSKYYIRIFKKQASGNNCWNCFRVQPRVAVGMALSSQDFFSSCPLDFVPDPRLLRRRVDVERTQRTPGPELTWPSRGYLTSGASVFPSVTWEQLCPGRVVVRDAGGASLAFQGHPGGEGACESKTLA